MRDVVVYPAVFERAWQEIRETSVNLWIGSIVESAIYQSVTMAEQARDLSRLLVGRMNDATLQVLKSYLLLDGSGHGNYDLMVVSKGRCEESPARQLVPRQIPIAPPMPVSPKLRAPGAATVIERSASPIANSGGFQNALLEQRGRLKPTQPRKQKSNDFGSHVLLSMKEKFRSLLHDDYSSGDSDGVEDLFC